MLVSYSDVVVMQSIKFYTNREYVTGGRSFDTPQVSLHPTTLKGVLLKRVSTDFLIIARMCDGKRKSWTLSDYNRGKYPLSALCMRFMHRRAMYLRTTL